jgi:hypothetical protein
MIGVVWVGGILRNGGLVLWCGVVGVVGGFSLGVCDGDSGYAVFPECISREANARKVAGLNRGRKRGASGIVRSEGRRGEGKCTW